MDKIEKIKQLTDMFYPTIEIEIIVNFLNENSKKK